MSISISVICRKNRVSVKNKVTPCIRMIQDRKASYVSIGFALNVEYWDFVSISFCWARLRTFSI